MMFRWSVLFLSLAVVSAEAQFTGNAKCTIRLDVVYASGGHAPAGLEVQLLKEMGSVVSITRTNGSGTAEFYDLQAGSYHAVVTGNGIETADSGTISVNDWNIFLSQTMAIRPSRNSNTSVPGPGTSPAISAVDLSAPLTAMKEYKRGNQEMEHKNWAKAADHFKKAIEIYPKFSAAYNNLAACYSELNQRDQQREALKKAIEFNDHCLPALLNLSDLDLQEKNVPEAGTLLGKALAVDPNNLQALTYLAQVDVAYGQYTLAIDAARKVHSQPHQGLAIVHFTAASAFEREGRVQDAIAELQVFLQESPQGSRADLARKAIAGLQKDVAIR